MKKLHKIKPTIYPHHLDIIGKSKIPSVYSSEYLEYRRKWETNPVERIVSEFPLQLDIESTGRCNLMCRHCYRFSRRTSVGDMDFDLFKRIIDEGHKYGLYAINLTWMGEPFLHEQIIEMINYSKSRGVLDIMIHTNGTLIDEKMSEKILDSGLDTITFSIDAVVEKHYNRIKYGSDFKLVNRNIRRFIELKNKRGQKKPVIIVQMIDQKQTHEELMAFVQYWRTKVDIIRISNYLSPDGKRNDKLRYKNPPKVIFPCPQLWQRLVIAWDGSVYPCCGDNACRDKLGNVNQTSIYEIWHCDRLNYLRNKHQQYEADSIDACMHCDANKIPELIDNYEKDIDTDEVKL